MSEVNLTFIYKNQKIEIQSQKDQCMKDIFSTFSTKASKDVKDLFFLYNGKTINETLKLGQINDKDNEITILANELVNDTQKEEVSSLEKNVLCPICGKICVININDYRITLNNCENNHYKNNILLENYKEIQNTIDFKVECNKCGKEKNEIYGKKLYICCTCNINLCPLCQSNHNKGHIIIDYDIKDYTCSIHGERYILYCKDCNKNLCDMCELEHNKNHYFVHHREILPNTEIKSNLENLKKIIDDFKKDSKKLIEFISETNYLMDIYYNLVKNIINSYQKKNRNYQILMNLNNLDISNQNIIKELSKILNEKDTEKKFSYIKTIYDKMNNYNEINKDIINEEKKINNNIIYYNENIKDLKTLYEDSNYFEKVTLGAFFLCTNIDSLKLISKEIIQKNIGDKNILFNLILGEFDLKILNDFLNENREFEKYIQKIFIYSKNLEKIQNFNINSLKILNTYDKREDIKNIMFILSPKNNNYFPIHKLIDYQDYLDKYKIFHNKISHFYGDLSPDTYKNYFEKLKIIINEEEKEKKLRKNKSELLQGFSSFEIKEDLKKVDKLIIREWTNSFYADLNKWLYNLNLDNFDPVAYFTSRFMYSLNSYAQANNYYCVENNKTLYRGVLKPYSNLIQYERAKGKIILLASFISTCEEEKRSDKWSKRDDSISIYKDRLLFSTKFFIKNQYKKNIISNGINIQNESKYKYEKEFLFQPFSFYYVVDAQIDINNYKADIYLETIGKEEILEEQIKKGKEIEFNEKEKIMQVKNN